MNAAKPRPRVLSGMRPTGQLHLGHYHGVIKPWVQLQHDHECFYMVADWHALTTEYDSASVNSMSENVWNMIIDWLASGVDPNLATIFIQSRVPEHAELYLLLSMVSPLGWLERVPSFKDQQDKLKDRDLSTHGFLGYPVLQSADILIYRATVVPVGEDQVPHIELTREIARRFNHMFGRGENYEELAQASIKKLGKNSARRFNALRKARTEQGDETALESVLQLLNNSQNISAEERDRLAGYFEGGGVKILPEPSAHLTEASKVPGLDGQKMSKSYNNAIFLRDNKDRVVNKVRSMPTDPARVRRNDPGNPEVCPVWDLHKVYSSVDTRDWVKQGCVSASIGCLDCKAPLIDEILNEQDAHAAKAQPYVDDPSFLHKVVADGCERAKDVASDTMNTVRNFVGTGGYR